MARRSRSDDGIIIAFLLAIGYVIYLVFKWLWKLIISVRDKRRKREIAEKEHRLKGLLQNEKFFNLIKTIIDNPNMKLPLGQATLEALCNELKQDGIEITTSQLQKDIKDGLVRYVIQEYVRAQLGDVVWPERHMITNVGLDGLLTLFAQKGAILPKPHLREMVNTEFLRQERERFKESFLRNNPRLRSQNILRLVEEYVDIFEESYQRQLENFVWFINEERPRKYSVSEVEELIQNEIKRRADLRMAEVIKSTIQTGHVNRRRIQIEDIDVMDGLEFEQFLEKLFTTMGYKVERTKASGDQGADLIAEKFGSRIAIQAKCYNGSVGNKAVQEVIGAMQYYRCERGMVVTNSTFTKSAIELAQISNVELIDRARLIELINKYGYEVEASSLTYKDQAVK